MAIYNKTLRPSDPFAGDNFQTLAHFRSWLGPNASDGDVINLEVEGGSSFSSNYFGGIMGINIVLNVYVNPSEAANGLPKFNPDGIDGVGLYGSQNDIINFDGLIINNVNPFVDYFLGQSVATYNLSNCIYIGDGKISGDCAINFDKSIIIWNGIGNSISFEFYNSTNAINNTIFLTYNDSTATAGLGDGGSNIDLTSCYFHNYGAGDFNTAGAKSETSVTKGATASPVTTDDMIQSNQEAVANIVSRDFSLDPLSTIYDFATHGIGIDSDYYTIFAVTPVITSLNPTSGVKKGGYTGLLSGTDFKVDQGSMTAGGVSCRILSWSDTSISFVFPRGDGEVSVEITNTDSLSDSITFSYQHKQRPSGGSRKPKYKLGIPSAVADRLYAISRKAQGAVKKARS